MNYRVEYGKRTTILVKVENGDVIVKAPYGVTDEFIEWFVEEKSDWINKKLDEHKKKVDALLPILQGRCVVYHGISLPVCISTSVNRACINGNAVYIPVKYSAPDAMHKAVGNMLKKLALKELADRLYLYAAQTGLRYNSFALTNARTQWGNCDGKCNIRLNWRLIMLDEGLIDYVIVHELAHTVHHNHSKAFWQKVSAMLPTYAAAKRRLKQYSAYTTLYR